MNRGPDRDHYERLIRDYFSAVDDERIDDVVACFTPDGWIQFPFHPEPVRGHEELRAFFAEHVGRFSEHVDRVPRVLVEGEAGISEIVFDATTTEGYPVHLENCNVYTFRDGLFAEVRVYLDTITMQEQLSGETSH
jgi:ketosteroid isomerase-like protein